MQSNSRSADKMRGLSIFGLDMVETDACLFDQPFQIVKNQVAPKRLAGRDRSQANDWWRHARPSPKYREALTSLPCVIVTPTVAKHRTFVFLDPGESADHQLAIVARADDTTFGLLHSRFHKFWSLRMCTWLGKGNDPRYTPTTTFETFPFPEGLTPTDTQGASETLDSGAVLPPVAEERRAVAVLIAEAAHRLNSLRERWLNPPEWVERVPEMVPGYPDRLIPKPEQEQELKKRTLTNLYHARPAWLEQAHQVFDTAVAAA